MTVFISYARKDRELVDVLARDIERAKQRVWLDHDLTGGQDWWDTILAQIRDCRLFIFVLTPDSIRSKACIAELRYASDLARPIVPVMVRDVAVQLAPHAIARAHIVDYRQRTAEAAVDLMNAIVSAPDPVPLPAPLPEPPTLPASYASSLRDQIGADTLTLREQGSVLMELKAHLGDAEERDIVLELLHDLRRRSDITEVVARDLDVLLAGQSASHAGGPREPEVSAVADPGSHAPDARREPTGATSNANHSAKRDPDEPIPARDEPAGRGDDADGDKTTAHRRRGALILVVFAVVAVVAVVAVAAIVVLTRGGGDGADGLDVESAEGNFATILDEAPFDDAGVAILDECPLGDVTDLVRTVDDDVPLSDATVEGDTFFEARSTSEGAARVFCGIEASEHESTDGIWGFTAYAIGDAASEYESVLSGFGAEERGDYLGGRIVQQPGTAENGDACISFWAPFDAELGIGVELYGDGCTLEGASLALEAVLPGMIASLA